MATKVYDVIRFRGTRREKVSGKLTLRDTRSNSFTYRATDPPTRAALASLRHGLPGLRHSVRTPSRRLPRGREVDASLPTTGFIGDRKRPTTSLVSARNSDAVEAYLKRLGLSLRRT